METCNGQCDFCGGVHPSSSCLSRMQVQLKACPRCLSRDHYWRCCPHRNNFCGRCKEKGHVREACPESAVGRTPQSGSTERPEFAPETNADQPGATSSVTFTPDGKITITGTMQMLASLTTLLGAIQPFRESPAPEANNEQDQRPGGLSTTSVRVRTTLPRNLTDDAQVGLNSSRRWAQDLQPPSSRSAVQTGPPMMNPTRRSLSRRSDLNETNYLDRLGIFDNPLWPTLNEFTCPLCNVLVERFQGVLLKNCQIHRFCRNCLRQAALDSPWLEVNCPLSIQCNSRITEGELHELLSLHPHLFEVYASKRPRQLVENDLTQLYPFIIDREILVNLEEFECPICMEMVPVLEGVCAKSCGVHYVCKECMCRQIRASEDPLPRCPGINCDARLLDVEAQYLEPEHHKRLLALGVERAVASAGDEAFHCMMPDCPGMWFVDEVADGRFDCPVCSEVNCLTCKVVHGNRQSCEEHRRDLATQQHNTQAEVQSQAHIQNMLDSGRAMLCPRCTALVQKTTGCDAITCSRCQTELCWATKGPRWGPGGKGDWSGGCRCRYNGGPRCHPNCQFCH